MTFEVLSLRLQCASMNFVRIRLKLGKPQTKIEQRVVDATIEEVW
jgi:hypothetical protein